MVAEPKLEGTGILEKEEKSVLKAPWVLPGVPSPLHVEGLTPCGIPSLQMTLATCRVGGGAEDRGAGCFRWSGQQRNRLVTLDGEAEGRGRRGSPGMPGAARAARWERHRATEGAEELASRG